MTYKTAHFPGKMLYSNGEIYRYFGGTSYLGLQTDTAFQELYIANIKKYGTNYGASRKSNVQLTIFDEVEAHLAQLVGSASCITLSSGYLAGQLIAKQFNTDGYDCFYAPNTHCALFANTPVIAESYPDLHTAVRHSLQRQQKTSPVVFLDAIDFAGVNFPHFLALKELPLHQLILVVDDSHGLGIVGETGAGVFEQLMQLKPKELVVSSSLGKGFGVQAGAIFGTKKRLEALTETEFFGGASPATPAALATFLQAETLYKSKREQLQKNINLFISEVELILNFSWMPNHPAFSFSNDKLVSFLENQKIIVSNFNYPNEDASVVSRIIISAAHTAEDITMLAQQINSFFR